MGRALLLATLISLGWSEPAQAKCAMPMAFVAPDQPTLPPDPVLFVFAPAWNVEKVSLSVTDGAGKALPFESRLVGESKAFVARRVEVKAKAGEVVVELRDPDELGQRQPTVRRFRIEPRTARAPGKPVTVTHVERKSYRWTCSSQLSQNLTPSVVAPAYRVEWAATEEDWKAGRRKSLVVPDRMLRFFSSKDLPPTGLVELGQIDCQGPSFDWGEQPIWVGLAALYADGSEDPPAKEPVRIESP